MAHTRAHGHIKIPAQGEREFIQMQWSTSLLRNRNFLAYWSGGLVSGLGDAMFLLALNWMVVAKTSSGLILGTLMACMSIPQILLATVGGVLVDRWNPKWVMITADAVRCASMVFLLFMSFDGVPPVWTLFCVAIVFGCMDALFIPANSAFQQRLVSSDEYTQSFGLLMVGFQAAAIAGPVLGGALISNGSYQTVIATNAASFIVGILLLYFVKQVNRAPAPVSGPAPAPEPSDAPAPTAAPVGRRTSFAKDLQVGIRYVFSHPLILTTSIGAFFVNACVQATFIAIPFLAKQAHLGAQGFGYMNMGVGIGGAVAAIFFAMVRIQKPTPRMTFLACFVEGLAFIGLAVSKDLWILVVMMMVIGIMEASVNTVAPSVNQRIIPSHLIGRVISFMVVLMSGSEPLARALSGWMIQWSGVLALLLSAGVLEIIVAVVGFYMPAVRRYSTHVEEAA